MRRRSARLAATVVVSALLSTGLAVRAGPTTAGQGDVAVGAYDESVLAPLKWRNIGPNRGGRSTAVAGSAARPLEYYFGATGGGLWKTTDGGVTWSPIADKALASSSVGAIAVAASSPDVVYVGMGETQLRGNVIQGDGVYKTTDGGKTWNRVDLERTLAIARIRVHPANPDVVLVAALGDPFAASGDRGVYRSTDGGRSWDRVLFRNDRTGAVDLALDPAHPDVVFATLWEVSRTPWSLSSGGPGSGLFKSTDGGTTWTEITRSPGLPAGIWGKAGVSVSPVDGQRVYLIVENEEGGVFVSDDGGATWKLASGDRNLRQRAFYYTRIYAHPRDRDTVYVLNVAFHRSTDGGRTYRRIRVPHGDNHDLWIAPDNPQRMIESNDGGAAVTTNGGDSWTPLAFPTAQFYNVVTTRHVPYHVCGAQQDNSTACVPSTGGPFYAVGGCESGYVAPDPRNLDVFYAGCYGGLLTRTDRRTGQSRAVNIWPENPMGHSARDLTERFQWTFPIVFSPVDAGVLYAASQHLWRTTNGGQSWERISPDLTRADSATLGPSGGPITLDQTGVETYATIFTVAPSRLERDTIWTGSDDGVVYITRDAGANWHKITPPGLPDFARISLIEASPHRPGGAYLAANRYQLGDRRPYVFRTDDYGATWTPIVGGLPTDDFARAIREDPRRPGLLFLGTEHGIYVSFDNGADWKSLRGELPVTPVHGIAVEGDDLVIGTHGRSFWVLPGIGLLRQLTPEVTASKLWLFTPADAVRYRVPGAFGTTVPPLAVDYYLQQEADAVTVEILDAAGRVIRTMRSGSEGAKDERTDKKEEAEEDDEEENVARPPHVRVGRSKGTNRVLWDLRYEGATWFPRLIMWAASTRGPLAPPGEYSVRVTALGETRIQRFAIRRDERLADVTDADLQEQFTLAMQIRDRLSQANDAVRRIRSLRDQVLNRSELAKTTAITTAARSFAGRLTGIEGEIYQFRNQSRQDPLNYPIRLNNRIGALLGVVESADTRPSDQARAVFEKLGAELDRQLSRLDTLVATELPAFNKMVAARKLSPVTDDRGTRPAPAESAPSAEPKP